MGKQKHNVKKPIYEAKQHLCTCVTLFCHFFARASRFFVHFFAVAARDYDLKFHGGR